MTSELLFAIISCTIALVGVFLPTLLAFRKDLGSLRDSVSDLRERVARVESMLVHDVSAARGISLEEAVERALEAQRHNTVDRMRMDEKQLASIERQLRSLMEER